MSTWQQAYITALGGKATPQAVAFLSKWQPWEGGHTANDARFNYLNTTETMPGSHSINSVGVQAYPSLAIGAKAFARTLLTNPHYAGLVSYLRTGQGDPTPGLATWVSGSPTSQHGLTYASKILGTPAPATDTPLAAPGSPQAAPDALPAAPQQGPDDLASGMRAQALSNIQDIASGKEVQPTDTLASIAKLVQTLHASVPQVVAPAAGQSSSLETSAVNLARKYIGVKYTWGGESAQTGFDCSGLIQSVWKQLGVDIPRTTFQQWDAGTPVQKLLPGDAVFFTGSDPQGGKPGHVGLYIGNGKYIAAPHSGATVSVFNLADAKDYVGARRFSGGANGNAT